MNETIIGRASVPDETRVFEKGNLQVTKLGAVTVGRARFEPGWRWSLHVKPLAKTVSCQAPHAGYILSGRMKIVMDDGTEGEAGPGDSFVIPPGHDAWVVGDEACEALDFGGAAEYAKEANAPAKAA